MLDRLLEKLETKSLAKGAPDDDDDDDDEVDRNDNDEEAVPDEDDDDDDEVDRNNNDEGSEEYEGKGSKSDKKLKHIKQFDSVATKKGNYGAEYLKYLSSLQRIFHKIYTWYWRVCFIWVKLSAMNRDAGISLGMRPANERRRYNVTTSLIGWAHTQTDMIHLPIFFNVGSLGQ